MGCAIFGITEVPTDGIDFDTADYGYTSTNNAGQPAAPTGAPYIPPPPSSVGVATEQPAATLVPETRQGDSSTGNSAIPPPTVPVDLLSDAEQGQSSPPKETKSAEFHDLD